ncbi:putative esterase [Alishewanella aestuarii B11]|uniref:Putative esterase n=1 Tax=Alishewanella aestuarii B11 TaxID=1197174 RepID=J1PYR8_9ALTE|nr:hypothetical protein [Alishewanella aestuarii]EJI83853.1 putative esterase [Alishewanella aestuarii B11]
MAQIINEMIALLALLLVSLTGGYLVALGLVALLRPQQAQSFLLGFASSARLHYLEIVIRMLVGLAFIYSAEYVFSARAFTGFGWLLVLTSLPLLLLPWQWHRHFAAKAVSASRHYLAFIGGGCLNAGCCYLIGNTKKYISAGWRAVKFSAGIKGRLL